MRQNTGPLNPLDFQAELEKRAAEEKEKLEQFKAHEEKMKAYQEAKRKGQKPPLGNQNSNIPEGVATNIKQQRGNKTQLSKNNKMVNKRASSKDVQQVANASSKSTTANTNEENQNADSDEQNDFNQENMPFIIENESGERGAKPESN